VTTGIDAQARMRLAREGIHVSGWGNGPGDTYAPHVHDYDKVLVAVDGSITFHLADRGVAIELRAGDRLDLPADTRHGADVGPEGVRCLEGHLPKGSLHAEPRRMADWAATARQDQGPQTDGDRET
jgi:mannose-6-phosphate isomerase-like protein (cupin superfamily)